MRRKAMLQFTRMSGLALAGVAGASLAFAGAAQAKSVNDVLVDLTDDLTPGTQQNYTLEDADRTTVIDRDRSRTLSTGDAIRGTFVMDAISEQEMGSAHGSNYFFGRYSLEVTSIDDDMVTLGVDTQNPFGSGDNRVFEFYENPNEGLTLSDFNNDFANGGFDASLFGDAATELWAATELDPSKVADGDHIYQLRNFATDDDGDPVWELADLLSGNFTPTHPQNDNVVADLGEVRMDFVDNVGNLFGSALYEVGNPSGAFDANLTTSDLRIITQNDAEKIMRSRAEFNTSLSIVPLPAAAWGGLALLGLLGGGRVMRRRNA